MAANLSGLLVIQELAGTWHLFAWSRPTINSVDSLYNKRNKFLLDGPLDSKL